MHNNNATRAFFKSGSGLVLAVYDTRRGQVEGREAEKILAFYPAAATASMQSSIVGLAQALTMFAGTFNKECPFHTMEAHGHTWTMYHAEPDLWLLLVVGRALVGPHCLASSLAGFLKGLHALVVLLHGLLSTQQEQDPSGLHMRGRLQPLLQEAAASLLQLDATGLWPVSCPLGLTGGVPLLPVSSGGFTRLQSLTNSLLVARVFDCRPVLGVLAAWQTCVLWSSMSSADTAALHSLAVRALEPAAREGPRHKTMRRPLGGTAQHLHQSQQGAAAATADPHGSSSSSSIWLANPACWYSRPDGLLLPVAASTSSSAADGSTSGGGAAAANGLEFPEVWLQSGCERAQLMAWHSGPLLLLVLLECRSPTAAAAATTSPGPPSLPVSTPASSAADVSISSHNAGPAATAAAASQTAAATAATAASLLELLAGPGHALAGQLAGELPAKHLWHVQGLRYLYQDHLAGAMRASPLRKVATLSQPSLHLTADARRWTALEATAAVDPTAPALGEQGAGAAASAAAAAATAASSQRSSGSGSGGISTDSSVAEQWESFAAGGSEANVEVVVRGANDCWVVGRHTAAGRQLTAAAEGDKDRGLLGFMRRVQTFCDTEVPGVFEGMF